jgi:hypothetical protein
MSVVAAQPPRVPLGRQRPEFCGGGAIGLRYFMSRNFGLRPRFTN